MTFNFRNNNIFLVAILVLAAALRLYKSDFQNLWLDEVLTMNSADPKLSLKQMYDSVMFWEYIPHFFFFLNRIIFEIFGFSSVVARILSGVIGIAGVYGIYLLGKEIFNRKVGLIAALLLAVNTFHIYYSQEIRPYGLLFLFSVLSFYRLVIFIKKPSLKNSIYYGVFTGLIVNAHVFGLITIFSQGLILLSFLFLKSKQERAAFFKWMLAGGGIALLFALPAYEPFKRVSGIKSFWMAKPGPTVYTDMLKEFFGNTEILLCCFWLVIIYYIVTLFRQKMRVYNYETISNNKVIFSFIILVVWLFVSLSLPLIKSYLSASMMVTRYFISVVAILLLIIAIGLSLIKNRIAFIAVVSFAVFFSLVYHFVERDYYNRVTKTQFREFAAALKENDTSEKTTIVTFYSWVLPYYFRDTPEISVLNNTLEKQVGAMKSGALPQMPFWYADFNLRPYELSGESQAYLDANFKLVKKLEFYDIWGNYYVPKSYQGVNKHEDGSQYTFLGTKMFFENGTLKSKELDLKKGKYKVVINGISMPDFPIKGENAHFTVRFAGKKAGEFYLDENTDKPEQIVWFSCKANMKGKLELVYDNDIFAEGKDRNATIYSVRINKVK